MKSLETPKAIAMMTLFTAVLAYSGPALGAGENPRCEARSLQTEAKLLRCVLSCRERSERRRTFNDERCLAKCESSYDEAFTQLLCPADRRLVRSLDGVESRELRSEALSLQQQARQLRCAARCEYSTEPDACVAQCNLEHDGACDPSSGECADLRFESASAAGASCSLSPDGATLECN